MYYDILIINTLECCVSIEKQNNKRNIFFLIQFIRVRYEGRFKFHCAAYRALMSNSEIGIPSSLKKSRTTRSFPVRSVTGHFYFCRFLLRVRNTIEIFPNSAG